MSDTWTGVKCLDTADGGICVSIGGPAPVDLPETGATTPIGVFGSTAILLGLALTLVARRRA